MGTDVLAALSRGRSNREIACALSLGEQTVKSNVSSILTELGLQDRISVFDCPTAVPAPAPA
ncbi:LuxR C-terminal-related transcriptional regulator [Dactylosporangium cerinum]|uniref:LuxR C-terminal-related transcriptional regulator n=1 Tax=Dactylosporangium cerinum TaxID=1434730 RepID=A0ABV9W463_9ACTN